MRRWRWNGRTSDTMTSRWMWQRGFQKWQVICALGIHQYQTMRCAGWGLIPSREKTFPYQHKVCPFFPDATSKGYQTIRRREGREERPTSNVHILFSKFPWTDWNGRTHGSLSFRASPERLLRIPNNENRSKKVLWFVSKSLGYSRPLIWEIQTVGSWGFSKEKK